MSIWMKVLLWFGSEQAGFLQPVLVIIFFSLATGHRLRPTSRRLSRLFLLFMTGRLSRAEVLRERVVCCLSYVKQDLKWRDVSETYSTISGRSVELSSTTWIHWHEIPDDLAHCRSEHFRLTHSKTLGWVLDKLASYARKLDSLEKSDNQTKAYNMITHNRIIRLTSYLVYTWYHSAK